MGYIIIVALLLAALYFLIKGAMQASREIEEEETRQAPILEAEKELSTLDRDHKVVDVKEKVVQSQRALDDRERKLEEPASPEVTTDETDNV